MITFYNSQSREVEPFTPGDVTDIRMYVCGPTVYGPAHIGNARPAIVFDQVFRLLREVYGDGEVSPDMPIVTYVRNITDIDDKIIAAANERGVPISQITDTATAAYHYDLGQLNCLEPSMEPRATDYVETMLALIGDMLADGYAYEVEGEVFFHVSRNPYPGLANHTHLESGSRVEVDSKKRDPRDFVLWKPAKEGEPSWDSPWGKGRPGWHIECSAMIHQLMGDTIDIHGGGADLRFPHHDAECAQSACAHGGRPLARYWMHNGLLTVEGEKMSKSRGNVILLNELFDRYPAESVRYYFLRTHYRSPMNFSWDGLDQAHRALSNLYDTLYRWDDLNWAEDTNLPAETLVSLCADLNTPAAITSIHALAKVLDEGLQERAMAKARLLKAGKMLGLFNHTPHQWRTFGVDKSKVEALITARQEARLNKQYAEADRIRQQLLDMGITLADGVHGTEWRRT